METPRVISVSKNPRHTFGKTATDRITLLKGLGVEGDAHMGETVKHRSRVAKDPSQPNLRQVHLMHAELFEELEAKDFQVSPAQMGENITTQGLDILNLPKDTILSIGSSAKIQITGLRNPCSQIDSIKQGLMKALLDRDEEGNLIRKAGIMAVVLEGGEVSVGDEIVVNLPEKPYQRLEKV
ncbi:MAG: MOSC domain-containing protein [Lewinellaceae bacterium]|nr:MOSC domain-containing protein [Saprospiraceae bacterium]MCB9343566.1 MOSC domain-containing protein [Lewinellaceae bacterium]